MSNHNNTILQHAHEALDKKGKFSYVLCLHILSQYDSNETDVNKTESKLANESPLCPASVIKQQTASKIEAGLEALKTYSADKSKDSNIENKKENDSNTADKSVLMLSKNHNKTTPLKIKKYGAHFNLSAWWSFVAHGIGSLVNLCWPSSPKASEYTAHQKTAILHASWHFCRKQEDDSLALETADTNKLKTDIPSKKATTAPQKNPQLKWAIFNATQAIKQHRKNTRDSLHWFYIAVTWFYALSCGLTVAGAVFVLVGSGGLAIPLIIISGLTTWWVNWKNGRIRIPEVLEELLYMPTPTDVTPGFIGKLLPGLVYYVDETSNTVKSFNRVQLGSVAFGLLCSFGVGMAIGAITYTFSMELAGLIGIAATGFFPPLLGIIIATAIIAELGLQLKSFIEIVRFELLKDRKKAFDQKLKGKTKFTRACAYTVGIITMIICTIALFSLCMACRKSMNISLGTLFPKAVDATIMTVAWVITGFHFLGTLPFLFDTTIIATDTAAQSIVGNNDQKADQEEKKTKWQNFKNACHTKWTTFKQTSKTAGKKYGGVFFLAFLLIFAGALLFLSSGAGSIVGIPLVILIVKSFSIGLGGGIIGSLAYKHHLSTREDPETEPPFFAMLGNGVLNGFMAISEGPLGIVTNMVLSIVSAFAGYSLPESESYMHNQKTKRNNDILDSFNLNNDQKTMPKDSNTHEESSSDIGNTLPTFNISI